MPLKINNPLYQSIRSKDIAAIKRLYATDLPVDTDHPMDMDPLIAAFKTASDDTVRCVIDLLAGGNAGAGQHMNKYITRYIPYLFRGESNWLCLFIKTFGIISFKGHESIFCKTAKPCHYRLLLSENVCFDMQNSLRYTIIYGRHAAFEYLLSLVKYQEQLDYVYLGPNGVQQTLLSLCATTGYYKGLTGLVKAGANVNIVSVNERGEGRNVLMAAVDNQHYHKLKDRDRLMVQRCIYYLASIYDINSHNACGQTALLFANRAGNSDLVKIILELGANGEK